MCKDEMFEMKSKQIPTDITMLADKLKEIYNGLKDSSI